MVKNRAFAAGGCYYKNAVTKTVCWLAPNSGNMADKVCQWNWVLTDDLCGKATTVYACAATAPEYGTADCWNQPGQYPPNAIWQGAWSLGAFPNITNVCSVPFGPVAISKLKSFSLASLGVGDLTMTMSAPDVMGTNDYADMGNVTNVCHTYGIPLENGPRYSWSGGQWGFNGAPANYGSNPGGLPWITNYVAYDSVNNTVKVDLRGAGTDTIAVMFYIPQLPESLTANKGANYVPITVTGSQNATSYTLQSSGDTSNWQDVITLNIIGDGQFTFLDNFAPENGSYRMKAIKP